MESLNEYRALVAVVEAGSIRGASEASNLPRSTLSRAIQRLEERLGVDLFDRSGRTLTVTDAGRLLYERARDFLGDIAAGEAAVQRLQEDRERTLTVSVPRTSGNPALVEMVSSFAEAHPDIQLRVIATNRYVDLEADRVDVAIRAGRIGPPEHVARKIADIEWGLYASESWLDNHDTPQDESALFDAPLIVVTTRTGDALWPFGLPLDERANVVMETTDFAIARSAVGRDLGIGAIPTLHMPIATGRVMADTFSASVDLCVFFRRDDRDHPNVRAFVEHAAEHMRESMPGDHESIE
jgi:DNA-binding transcriptional LysR family regulator